MSMRDQMSVQTQINSPPNVRPTLSNPMSVNFPKSSSSHSPTLNSSVPIEPKKTPKDFIFGKVIGEGSFSSVYLAKDINSEKEFAIKVCQKRHILKEKKQASVMRERKVLFILNSNPSPYFVKLFYTFQDLERLYFVLTYAKCGEMLPYMKKGRPLNEPCAQFYAAEILCALEHLHKLGIIHRDLKPENILLNEDMHILVTDFGSAKLVNQEERNDKSETPTRKNSFVGTAEYVSPELLTNKCVHESSDLWALGCIIYQMLSGSPPFQAANEYLIFQKILKLDYVFTDEFSSVAKDLVKNLLVNDPKQRLGSSDTDGYPTIKSHKFFSGINWTELYKQQPPHMLPHAAEASSREKLKSGYQIPSHLEPGLDDKQMTRLLGLDLHDDDDEPKAKTEEAPKPVRTRKTSVLEYSPSEISRKVEEQAQNNVWHRFVQGNLILKQGLVDKRKGLFARRRMLLLTTGPRLFYVDPVNMVLKGEIPWSHDLKPEPKNFKTFFVHTPNRTYYLEDPEGYALEWCRVIDEVRKSTYNIT